MEEHDTIPDFKAYLETDQFLEYSEQLPADEFVEEFEKHPCGKTFHGTNRDGYAILSGFQSLYQHLSHTEFFLIMGMSLGMTLFFCLYYYPAPYPEEDYRLAARLRFNLIATAVVFPSTMLVAETMQRRETILKRYASTKAILCNILLAFLTWRAPAIVMTQEWEANALEITKNCAQIVRALLSLPTLRDRHTVSSQGRLFAQKVLFHRNALQAQLIKEVFRMHELVEDLKSKGLSPMESIRLFQYIQIFYRDFEQMFCIKVYRSGRTARAFVRIVLSACLMFYGWVFTVHLANKAPQQSTHARCYNRPYYSYVAGAIAGSSGQMNIPFSCILSIISSMLLLAIVSIHRATEDPFIWRYPGNAVDTKFEADDALEKMQTIYKVRRMPELRRHAPV